MSRCSDRRPYLQIGSVPDREHVSTGRSEIVAKGASFWGSPAALGTYLPTCLYIVYLVGSGKQG
jgi:hypothetical protein